MIKTVKIITWIIVGLTMYSFVGGMVYNVHERFYPGVTVTSNPDDIAFPGSEFMGALWPVSVPLWATFVLGSMVSELADSAMDELIDE